MKNKRENIIDAIVTSVACIITFSLGYFVGYYNNKNKKPDIPTPVEKEIIDTLLLHAKLLTIQKGEHIAMIEMRSHAAWYLKLIPQTKTYRTAIVAIKTYEELEKICEAVLKKWSF